MFSVHLLRCCCSNSHQHYAIHRLSSFRLIWLLVAWFTVLHCVGKKKPKKNKSDCTKSQKQGIFCSMNSLDSFKKLLGTFVWDPGPCWHDWTASLRQICQLYIQATHLLFCCIKKVIDWIQIWPLKYTVKFMEPVSDVLCLVTWCIIIF